jgi:hypothetical protein
MAYALKCTRLKMWDLVPSSGRRWRAWIIRRSLTFRFNRRHQQLTGSALLPVAPTGPEHRSPPLPRPHRHGSRTPDIGTGPLRTYAIRMFVLWVVTDETASSTPGRHPTPNLTKAPASPGGNSPPGHWSGSWTASSMARSPPRLTAGSPTCASRTLPDSHPSPPSAGSPRSRRRSWRPTTYGRLGDSPRRMTRRRFG